MKTKQIAIFPLDVVLFPGEEIELHIFEDRYKLLFAELIEQDAVAGIVRRDGAKGVQSRGTTFKVVDVINTYKSGEMDVLIRGEEIFNLLDFEEFPTDTAYPLGKVHALETEAFSKVPQELLALANEALRVVTGNSNRPWSSLLLMSDLLQILQLPTDIKEQYLNMADTSHWVSFIAGQLKLFISIQSQMRQLRGNVQLN